MLSGKVMIIHLKVGLIKKILLSKISYFSELYTHVKNKKKVNSVCLIMQQNLI